MTKKKYNQRYKLTWRKSDKAKRGYWSKKYKDRKYFLKTYSTSKRDREAYEAALREWERLEAYLTGRGSCPYVVTYDETGKEKWGDLIPESPFGHEPPEELTTQALAPQAVLSQAEPVRQLERPSKRRRQPEFVVGVGLGSFDEEFVYRPVKGNLYSGEQRIATLIDAYNQRRHLEVKAGDLSINQWAEDKAQLEQFRRFCEANGMVVLLSQVDAALMNLYRDFQTEKCTSKRTLKKRLDSLCKWLKWLIDENILAEAPKDLSSYSRMKFSRPAPKQFTIEQVKVLYGAINDDLLRACFLLAINAGMTQKEIATLEYKMIDWQTGILERPRHKTGIPTKAKLWPITLKALTSVARESGPLLVSPTGQPLVREWINKDGSLRRTDTIRNSFYKLCKAQGTGGDLTFKNLRKTSSDLIERWEPALSGLFLSHAEHGTKKYYVNQHFERLFVLTDKLLDEYKLTEVEA